MSTPADNSVVFLPGPWEHRLLQANGCQFHLAHIGQHHDDLPLVLFVHGFPEYWWAWRDQLAAVADLGYEVAAIDQRGIGGSDKTPSSSDGMLLTQDLVAIVRALGASKAVLVGHGRGGTLTWSAAALEPELFSGILTVAAPHPRSLQRIGGHVTLKTWKHVLDTFTPFLTKKRLTDDEQLRRLITQWSAPGNTGASGQADKYAAALRLPEAAESALEQLRWHYLSRGKINGREHLHITRRNITLPVWAVRGKDDPLLPARAWRKDTDFVQANYRYIEVPRAGHFVHEEQPEVLTSIIKDFLVSLA